MKLSSRQSIILACSCTLFTSTGQYFLKIGTEYVSEDIISIINLNLILGFTLYSIGGFLLILALSKGDLSMIYPLISLSFIWVFLISFFILNEDISLINWSGLVTIILGVIIVGNSGSGTADG